MERLGVFVAIAVLMDFSRLTLESIIVPGEVLNNDEDDGDMRSPVCHYTLGMYAALECCCWLC
jgi:hypothetical protein